MVLDYHHFAVYPRGTNGIINQLLQQTGSSQPDPFPVSDKMFYVLAINCCPCGKRPLERDYFLASITNVDPTRYEAAAVDGRPGA